MIMVWDEERLVAQYREVYYVIMIMFWDKERLVAQYNGVHYVIMIMVWTKSEYGVTIVHFTIV